ncbi:MAG: glycosyltransferase family 39 protein [Phototrophicaceae bacterium]
MSEVVHRFKSARLWAMLALSFAIGGAWLFTLHPSVGLRYDLTLNGGLVCWLLAALTLWRALVLRPSYALALAPMPSPSSPYQRRHALIACVGVICLIILTLPELRFGRDLGVDDIPLHLQALLLFGGLGAVGWGLSGERLPLPPARAWLRWDGLLPLGLITLAGLALRGWNPGLFHGFVDEIHFVEPITKMMDGERFDLLEPLNYIATFSGVQSYVGYLGTLVFGGGFTAVRLPSIIWGTLAIPAVYCVARAIFDRPTAILAALLLACYPPHIHFSRTALNNIADPTFGMWALALVLWGAHTGRRSYFAWAGVALGFVHYFYEGGRLVFTAVFVLIVLWFPTWRYTRKLTVTAVAALLIAAPIVTGLTVNSGSASPRLADNFLLGRYWTNLLLSRNSTFFLERYLNERLGPALLLFVHNPDSNGFYYNANDPLILPLLVPLFFLGMGATLWAWFGGRHGAGALLLIFFGTLFGNSLIGTNVWSPRYVVAFPVVAVLAAAGLSALPSLLIPNRRRVQLGVLATLGIGLALTQAVYFYGVHMPSYQRSARLFRDYDDVAIRAAALPPETAILLVVDRAVWNANIVTTLRLLGAADHVISLIPPENLAAASIRSMQTEPPIAVFLSPDQTALLNKLQQRYGNIAPVPSPYNVPADLQYWLYYVPE